MSIADISELEAELECLELQKDFLLELFNSEENVVNFEQLLTRIVELCTKIRRNTLVLKSLYEEKIKLIDIKIEKKRRREDRGNSTGRPRKKRRNSFFHEFSQRNADRISYFRVETGQSNLGTGQPCLQREWCTPFENEELIEIRVSGYRFISSLENDYKKCGKRERDQLLDAMTRCEQHDNLNRMWNLYHLSKLPVDEEIVAYIERRKEELTAPSDVSMIGANAETVDWNLVSALRYGNRRSPEELEALWRLVTSPDVQTEPWTLVEDILLRCLAQENRFQNWDYINERMPTPRSGFLCFARYMHLYQWKGATARRWWRLRRAPAVKKNARELISDDEPGSKCPATRKRGTFTKREKFVIYHYLKRGCSYKAVARMLPNRTEKQIREHHNTSITRKNFGAWSRIEDSRLLWATRYLGRGNWRIIREFTERRTSDQCRSRFRFLMKHDTERVQKLLYRKFEKPKTLQKKIEKFLKKMPTKPELNRRVELYFYLQLDRVVQQARNRVHVPDDVSKLLRFLNFENLSLPPDNEFTDWLVNYPPTSVEAERAYDEAFSTDFARLRKNQSTWPIKPVKAVFSHVLYKKCRVLPPSKSGIYGLLTFEQQYQTYFEENNHIDPGMLWKKQNDIYGREKSFNEAKMLWYNVLKAILFWPLKLKAIGRPEDFLL